MERGLLEYYGAHPDRLDERGADALKYSARGLQHVLDVLEGYDIRDKSRGGKE